MGVGRLKNREARQLITNLPNNLIEVPDIGFYDLREEMTDEQLLFANAILQKNIVFSNSASGTGKTTIALASLFYLYELGIIEKVYYIFSPIEEGKMGHRPGYQKEKNEEYLHPLKKAILKIGQLPERALDENYGWCEAQPDTFMRGTDLEKVGVIVDEAQNHTRGQLKKELTRLHDNCHGVVVGHEEQIDLKNKDQSGFAYCIEHFSKLGIKVGNVPLTKNFRGWISTHADKMED